MNNYELTKTILCLDNVSAGYDGKTILKNVNLSIKDVVREGMTGTGQITAVVGRSGRGKSTLFKVLTGLINQIKEPVKRYPDHSWRTGRVLISSPIATDPDSAKEVVEGDVGFVDQKYTLFRHKTVNSIMQYAIDKKKNHLSKIDKNKLIEEQLETWGLKDHKDKYPCELSGGQRQRTAIIEQLLTSKHFMVFDEPFSGLDVGNIEKVKDAFNLILNEGEELNTIIFSTHDLKLAVELADLIFVIGYPEGTTEYSTVIQKYDLKALGLAWTKFGQGHLDLMRQIKEVMLKS